MLLGVSLTLAGPMLRDILSTLVPVESLSPQAWPYLQWCLAALFIFAAIELLYILAPNVDPAQRLTIPGALVAAGTWMALAWGLRFLLISVRSSRSSTRPHPPVREWSLRQVAEAAESLPEASPAAALVPAATTLHNSPPKKRTWLTTFIQSRTASSPPMAP
jgi:Virulence factor BrkB